MLPLARYCGGLCPSHSPAWSPRIPLTFWSWISGGAQVCSRWGHDSASWCQAGLFGGAHSTQKHPCQPALTLPCFTILPTHNSTRQSIPWWCKVDTSGVMIVLAGVGQAFLVVHHAPKAPLPACPHCHASPFFPPITPPGNPPR